MSDDHGQDHTAEEQAPAVEPIADAAMQIEPPEPAVEAVPIVDIPDAPAEEHVGPSPAEHIMGILAHMHEGMRSLFHAQMTGPTPWQRTWIAESEKRLDAARAALMPPEDE
jgi:hypothetical protein